MTDIVKRLRSVSGCTQKTFMHSLNWEEGSRIIGEAADYIEYLQATETNEILKLYHALQEIAAMDPKGIRADDLGRAARIASEALRMRTLPPATHEDVGGSK